LGEKINETPPSQPVSWVSWPLPVIPDMQEVEIGESMVQAGLGKNSTPFEKN
jgi:hypothetical protein